jgi:hypothetical protein
MKTIKITVTYKYKLKIDENSDIVKSYESENDLLFHCASCQFKPILPVIVNSGVTVLGVELERID